MGEGDQDEYPLVSHTMDNDDKTLHRALGRSLNLISYRQRTEFELRQRLSPKFSPDVVDRTIQYLKEQGLIDDAQFAEAWTSSRTRNSPRSSKAISRELADKGVARTLADDAVRDLDDDSTARSAATRFSRRLADADYTQFHRRLWAHLSRRGYSGSVARRAVSEIWQKRLDEQGHQHSR